MIVRCTAVGIEGLAPAQRENLEPYIKLEGGFQELDLEQEYIVFAVEQRQGTVWVYIETIDGAGFPSPYPIELFRIVDAAIPGSWKMKLKSEAGRTSIARMSFGKWVDGDRFYERLIDGDAEAARDYGQAREACQPG